MITDPKKESKPLDFDLKRKEASSTHRESVRSFFTHSDYQKINEDDPLLSCLEILASFHEMPTSTTSLKAGLPLDQQPLTPALFIRAAHRIGLSARQMRKKLSEISPFTLPCVLILEGGKACLMTSQISSEEVEVIFPETGQGATLIYVEDLNLIYSGHALFCQPQYKYDARISDIEIEKPKNWFWGTLAKSWPVYGQVAMAAILINLFAMASSLYVMNVYDRVVPNNATDTLWVLSLGIFIVFLFDFLLKSLRVYYIDSAGRSTDIILASRLFEHVLALRLASKPASAGGFANQLREFESLREFFSSATLVALVDLPFIFVFILIIASIGGSVAWVSLASIPLIIVVSLVLQGPLRRWVAQSFKEGAQKHSLLIEAIQGLETIKSFGGEGRLQRKWESAVSQSAASSNSVRFFNALATNFTGFIQQGSYVVTVIVGVYYISKGELTTGGLIACSILSSRAMAPLSQVVSLLSRFNQSRTALEALTKIIHLPTEKNDNQTYLHRPKLEGEIDFKDVSFSYPFQKTQALIKFSLSLKAGEKVGLVGRNGSGKSTIEKLLLNLYSPTEGSILIDQTDLRQIHPADLRSNIGYVPQDTYLFSGSVRDNITFGMSGITDEDILRAAVSSGAHDFIRQHPMGYDMPVGEGGFSLSGGQRQSIMLARALIRNASIIVLDEPTAMIDNMAEAQLIQRLRPILKNKTVFIISHRLPLLNLVDRIVVLDEGKIVADGPKKEVLRALSNSQIRSTG